MTTDDPLPHVVAALEAAGCLDPHAEAVELLAAAEGDGGRLDGLLARRVSGEPLPWIVGAVTFADQRLVIDRGVYVPRPHSAALARRAAELLPPDGTAVDLCTGCGAIAAVIAHTRPEARVVATDIDPAALACARRNDVDALLGDLDDPLPEDLRGRVDVMTAVVPYVPTAAMGLLPRDVVAFEPHHALDGGAGGLGYLLEVVERSRHWLTPGGWLLLELGGDQAGPVGDALRGASFGAVAVGRDEDGDDRMIEGRWSGAIE